MARLKRPSISKRDAYLRRVYGISLEQYQELLHRQGGGCAICGKTAAQEGRALAVDHNHATGEVRGILCYYHNNKLIGRHRDPELFRKAADYLDNHTGWFIPERKKKNRRRRKTRQRR